MRIKAGNTLSEDVRVIDFGAAASLVEASGRVTISGIAAAAHTVVQSAHGFTLGQAVRYNGTAYVTAKADAAANADVDGLISSVVDVNTFVIQTSGYFTGLTGLVAGSDYFLDPTTAGALTSTEPSAANQVSKPILHADSTTSGYLQNTRGLVIPSAATFPIGIKVIADATALTVAEGLAGITLPSRFNGLSLTSVVATLTTVSSSGLPSIGIRKNSTEMLSTNVTIDATELSSDTAATAAVIKSDGSQTVATGDTIWIDCDVAGTGAKGLFVELTFS